MAAVRLIGDSSGYSEIKPPANANNQVFILPASGGTFVTTSGAQSLVFASGSASEPSISTAGDPNTGIFFPAADTIAVAEGGAEALRVDSSGRVGIGTTSPAGSASNFIDVYGSASSTVNFHNATSGTASGDGGVVGQYGSDLVLFNYENGILQFGTNNAERARIDSSGRLLVGTATARSNFYNDTNSAFIQLESASNDGSALALIQNFNANTLGGQLILAKSNSASVGSNTLVASGDACGRVSFQGNDGTQFVEAAQIRCDIDGTPSANDMPGRLVFFTTSDGGSSPTERMRVQADGNVRIGNASTLYPQTDNSISLGVSGNRWSAVWAANGTIQTSDERSKTEIADSTLATDFVKSLRPVSYKWIEGGKRDTGERDEDNNFIYESVPGQRTHWGFIAQEVKQAVDAAGVDFGGWVLTDKDDPDSQQALRYDQFIAPLTKALQEALQKIEVLEQRLVDAGIA